MNDPKIPVSGLTWSAQLFLDDTSGQLLFQLKHLAFGLVQNLSGEFAVDVALRGLLVPSRGTTVLGSSTGCGILILKIFNVLALSCTQF